MTVANPTSGKTRAAARAERMCAATRRVLPTSAMIRFARRADGTVAPDIAHRLGGRGVWLTASVTILREAARRGVFAKGFKCDARAAATLAEETDAALAEAALKALADARRAGLVVTGPTAAATAAADGRAVALIAPSDTGAGEFASNGADLPVFAMFTTAQLGLALGAGDVVHAAVLASPAGIKFLSRCHSLVRFRTPEREAAHVAGTQAGKTPMKTETKTTTTTLQRVGNLNG